VARETAQEQGEPGRPYDPEQLPEHQRKRRERMIAAAIELIEDDDYDSIQIRDVAERAGVALGTVYRYFSSKEHLYAAVLLEWASGIAPKLAPINNRPESDEDRLRRVVRSVVKSFQRWPQMMRAEMVLETTSDPHAAALLQEFSRQHDGAIRSVLRDMSPADGEGVSDVVQCVLYRGLRSWALGRCSIADVERNAQRAIDLIFSPPPV
jgi:AcrR family transcriptional regulator